MKKVIIAAVAALAFASAAVAQPRNVGGFVSIFSQGAFYQHSISERQFVQVDLGTALPAMASEHILGFRTSATYNFIVGMCGDGFCNIYLGPGLAVGHDLGMYLVEGMNEYDYRVSPRNDIYTYLGVMTKFGVELNFRHNVTLTISHSPVADFGFGRRILSEYDVNDGIYAGSGRTEGEKVPCWGFLNAMNLYQILPTIGVSYRF